MSKFWGGGCCSVAPLCPILCNLMDCSRPAFRVLHYLLEIAQTHVHWVDDAIHHLILCCPVLLPSVFPSTRENELALCIRWPNYWSFSFSITSSNEYSGLISFRIYWFHLLAVQGTLNRVFFSTTVRINSSALNILYSSTFRSIHDYWKNHRFDYTWKMGGQLLNLVG